MRDSLNYYIKETGRCTDFKCTARFLCFFYLRWRNDDFFSFIKEPESLFKVFFAAIEHGSNHFGRRRVGDLHRAAIGLYVVHDNIGKPLHSLHFTVAELQVDFSIGAHILDESRVVLADVDILINLIVVNHSREEIVDNYLKSKIGAFNNENIGIFAEFIFRNFIVEELIEFSRSHNTLAFVVDVHIYDI